MKYKAGQILIDKISYDSTNNPFERSVFFIEYFGKTDFSSFEIVQIVHPDGSRSNQYEEWLDPACYLLTDIFVEK